MTTVRYIPPYETYSQSAGAKKFVSATAVADLGNSQALVVAPSDARFRQRIALGSVTWTNRSGSPASVALAARFATSAWAAGQVTAAGAFTDDTTDAQDADTGDFPLHNRAESGSGFVVSADAPFNILGIIQSAAGDQVTPVLVLDYWNGAWVDIAASLVIADVLIGDGTGEKVLLWPLPPDWVVGGSGTGISPTRYTVRVRHTTAGAGTADPVASQIFVGQAKAVVTALADDSIASMARHVEDAEMRFPRQGEALFPVFEVAARGNMIEADVRFTL